MKIKIAQIGTPKSIQTSRGTAEKNYIKTDEGQYAGKFLNYWVNNTTRAWREGMEVEIDRIESRDYTAKDGSLKSSYDIKLPNSQNSGAKIEEVLSTLTKMRLEIREGFTMLAELSGKKGNHPTPESVGIKEEDVPF